MRRNADAVLTLLDAYICNSSEGVGRVRGVGDAGSTGGAAEHTAYNDDSLRMLGGTTGRSGRTVGITPEMGRVR